MKVASDRGFEGKATVSEGAGTSNCPEQILICPDCGRPSFFDHEGEQTPGAPYGDHVEHIVDSAVLDLYQEARRCMTVSAYTATVMACRKLLQNLAVAKGADRDKSFAFYVQWLGDNGYVPPDGSAWVKHIKDKGNEANHEIPIISRQDGEDVLAFTSALLRFSYEFPGRLSAKGEAKDSQGA